MAHARCEYFIAKFLWAITQAAIFSLKVCQQRLEGIISYGKSEDRQ
jgi:hypothetical protein